MRTSGDFHSSAPLPLQPSPLGLRGPAGAGLALILALLVAWLWPRNYCDPQTEPYRCVPCDPCGYCVSGRQSDCATCGRKHIAYRDRCVPCVLNNVTQQCDPEKEFFKYSEELLGRVQDLLATKACAPEEPTPWSKPLAAHATPVNSIKDTLRPDSWEEQQKFDRAWKFALESVHMRQYTFWGSMALEEKDGVKAVVLRCLPLSAPPKCMALWVARLAQANVHFFAMTAIACAAMLRLWAFQQRRQERRRLCEFVAGEVVRSLESLAEKPPYPVDTVKSELQEDPRYGDQIGLIWKDVVKQVETSPGIVVGAAPEGATWRWEMPLELTKTEE